MKKKIIVLALCVLLISGCGSKIPKLSNGDEAVVTLKDGEMISVNELYESLKSDYALQSLVDLMDKKILEDKYKDKVEEAKSSIENTMTQYEAAYGDELENTIIQFTGYPSVDAYKNALYINYLKNLAVEDYAKKQIKEKEVKEYYEKEIQPDIMVSHILITPAVNDSMSDEEVKKAEDEAKEKVESIIAELKKAKSDKVAEKFTELAKEYSMDESNKNNGGSLGKINKGTLSSEYDELVSAAYKLKDGDFSKSIVKTEIGYHIILRTETKEKASLEEVRDTVMTALASEYLSEHNVAYYEALQELRKEYNIEIVDTELKEKYATYIQNEYAYYKQLDEKK